MESEDHAHYCPYSYRIRKNNGEIGHDYYIERPGEEGRTPKEKEWEVDLVED